MIESLKSLFARPDAGGEAELEHRLRLAAAALLVEMSRADHAVEDAERRTMKAALHTALGLGDAELDELIELAGDTADRATSLYEFTRLINDRYDRRRKLLLIQSMWRVAFADGDLDKYEERLIRQVANLIHVPHSEFIRLKMEVAGETGRRP